MTNRIVATLQPKKAKLWDAVTAVPRTDRYPIDPNFIWQTQEGKLVRVQTMMTSHIWNSLKMIWNHRVPVQCRIIPFKHYGKIGPQHWKKKHARYAIKNLFNELMNRNDITPFVKESLKKMAKHMQSGNWNEKIEDK